MQRGYIYCIGIGGIGVSALARLYKSRGFQVSGSDAARSEITDALKKEGIRIFIGKHKKSNLAPRVSRVVYTAASRPDNPEIQEAKRRGIPAQSYARAVGELTRQFKTIAVAGAHGKSTTAAMTALMLRRAGLDPTVIVGTKLREFQNSNFRLGKSPYFVLEADEYRASFLNYSPRIAVITNIDREHLDFYKNVRNIEKTFFKFLLGLKAGGTAVLNRDDVRLRRIGARLARSRPDVRVLWFSFSDPQTRKIKSILRVPGRHNVANALAAHVVGRFMKIPEKKILAAFRSYRGSWRRFDYRGALALRPGSGQALRRGSGRALRPGSRRAGAKVFADYAHHPTEIKATLQAAREKFPQSRIWCVFQPHHYERTRDLWPEFVRAFDDCDALILLDIYEVAGRERKNKSRGVNSQKLAQAIRRRGIATTYLADAAELRFLLRAHLRRDCVLLMMGAGDIWEMTKQLMKPKSKD